MTDHYTSRKIEQSYNHARAVDRARKLARIVQHTDPPDYVLGWRAYVEQDLAWWLRHYMPAAFRDPFSEDHLRVLRKIEQAIHFGGMFALAMPRGHGKSTICRGAALYAILTGRRKYVVLIGATESAAASMLKAIKSQLGNNERLIADYPEACYYIQKLDGKSIKAPHQLRNDEKHTGIVWSSTGAVGIQFPTGRSRDGVEGYRCDGAVIRAFGLTGNIRGQAVETMNGGTIRPDLAILDDPQDSESARSPSQCRTRGELIQGDILNLAGHDSKIAAIMPCTIIQKNDLAFRFLYEEAKSGWQSEVCRLVKAWPKAQDTLWKEYADVYERGVRDGKGIEPATDFYNAHRAEMDDGADVSWPERVREHEVSAIQTAENLLIETGDQFWAEYQNEPKTRLAVPWESTEADVLNCLSHIPRGVVPKGCNVVTLAGDVNHYGISFIVTAWTDAGAGYVIDWGKWPSGPSAVIWSPKDHTKTIEQAIYRAALGWLTDLVARPYIHEGTQDRARINAACVDVSYKRDPIYMALNQFARQSHGIILKAMRGLSSLYYRQRNEPERGDMWHCWMWGNAQAMFINADYWRERMHRAWKMSPGTPGGSIGLYGKDASEHTVLADQVTAEYVADTGMSDRHGEFLKWAVKPGAKNDLGDALVYSFALASRMRVSFGAAGEWKKDRQTKLVDAKKIDSPTDPATTPPIKPARDPLIEAMRNRQRQGGGGFAGGWK